MLARQLTGRRHVFAILGLVIILNVTALAQSPWEPAANLSAAFYAIGRCFFLRDTGRKLRHLDHQLTIPDAVLDELGRDLTA